MINKRKAVIGAGVRVETHDPEVVAKTLEAKEKIAVSEETVTVEEAMNKLEYLRKVEADAHALMTHCYRRMNEAREDYIAAMHVWADAAEAADEEERNAG